MPPKRRNRGEQNHPAGRVPGAAATNAAAAAAGGTGGGQQRRGGNQNQNDNDNNNKNTKNKKSKKDRDHDSETDEEEPEGEELFDEHTWTRDYAERSDSEEGSFDDADINDEAGGDGGDGFIVDDDDSDADSEMSLAEQARAGRLLERRRQLERDMATEEERNKKRRDNKKKQRSGRDQVLGIGETQQDGDDNDIEGGGDSASKRRKRSKKNKEDGAEDDDYYYYDDDDDFDEEEEEEDEGAGSPGRRGINQNDDDDENESDGAGGFADENQGPFIVGEIPEEDIQWAKPRGDIADWLEQEAPRRLIKNRIFNFLWSFQKGGRNIYQDRIHLMARENAQSFEVSYVHFGEVHNSVLALWLAAVPEAMLELINESANAVVYHFLYPHYHRVHKSIRVRISDLPICDPIRDFRQVHRDVLVRVEGVITRRSPVYPQLQAVRYDCPKCAFIMGPVMQRNNTEVKVTQCPSCHSKGPFKINMALTEFRSHQSIVLQEPPGKVPPGRLPRSLEVTLTHDLIDRAKPGEEVEVIGIYKNTFDPILNSRQGFPVFTTVLIANNITKRTVDVLHYRLPDNERTKLLTMARHPNIKKKLMNSIAPSIHGRTDIKLGLLLVLLGGVAKEHHAHRIRGDINALLVGDPGTAKSQFLKFVEKTADRAVFTTGRGSTAVGLTASVHKDPVSGEFALEGGALVIADRGVCLIDEFDKMSDQDRTSIHEAMEQQTISVAKGGIVTTLTARCSVVAAANPVGGRYDSSLSFDANVDLTTPILSRFDLLFVVRDEVNPEEDTRLADFITRSHQRSHPSERDTQTQRKKEFKKRMAELQSRVSDLTQFQQQMNYYSSQRHNQGDDDDDENNNNNYEEETQNLQQQFNNMTQEEAAVELRELEQQLSQYEQALHAEETSREDDDPATDLPLSQDLLRKYILFARSQVRPRISQINGAPLEILFRNLRQESKRGGGIPVTVRHLESILRLSEAHARLHLREFVNDEDVSAAMALFLRCFLQTQKYSMRHALESRFREFLESDIEPQHLILNRLKTLVHQVREFERRITGVEPTSVSVDHADLVTSIAAMNVGRDALAQFYKSPLFVNNDFELLRDRQGVPLHIRHTLLS